MKKCQCGKEMEDWMTLCKDCYAKSRAPANGRTPRDDSIERQVAAKCASWALQGRTAGTELWDQWFDHIVKRIRGGL